MFSCLDGAGASDGAMAKNYKGDATTGFQSPAEGYIEPVIDLAEIIDLRRPSRYPVRVHGQRLNDRGIFDGDILVADAAADPKPGRVCVAFVNSDVILATLAKKDGQWRLTPSSGDPIAVAGEVEIWAVITALVRVDV